MNAIERIISRFGGLSAMSEKMSAALERPVPVSTIQYWAQQGYAPGRRAQQIIEVGKIYGIEIKPEHFFAEAS